MSANNNNNNNNLQDEVDRLQGEVENRNHIIRQQDVQYSDAHDRLREVGELTGSPPVGPLRGQGQVRTLQGQVGTLQGEVRTLQDQVGTLQDQVLTLDNDKAVLEGENTDLKKENKDLKGENTDLKKENKDQKHALEEIVASTKNEPLVKIHSLATTALAPAPKKQKTDN